MKSFKQFASFAALACVFTFVTAESRADVVTATGSGPVTLDGANSSFPGFVPNTLTLNTAVGNNTSATFTQTVIENAGYDGGASGPFAFTMLDTFTVGTDTFVETLSGTFLVSPTTDPDTVTFDGTSFTIDGRTFTLTGFSYPDTSPFPGGSTITNLVFVESDPNSNAAPVPEPSSLALLGTGILGAFGMARRRFVTS